MVGQRTMTKPSRSDEVLDADEQLRIANKIRAQFETLAPKRPVKPNRSEPDSSTPTPLESTAVDETIPELDKFRALGSQSHVIISAEGVTDQVQDEFVETQYYSKLQSVDKQHHTTGSGFIRVVGKDVKVADLMTFSWRDAMMAQVGWRTLASEAILRQTIGFQTSMKIRSLSPQSQIGARVLRYAGAGGTRETLTLRKGLACTNFTCSVLLDKA